MARCQKTWLDPETMKSVRCSNETDRTRETLSGDVIYECDECVAKIATIAFVMGRVGVHG